MTMAFYNGGIRVVDLNGLAGIGLGDTTVAGSPMVELGHYYFPNSDTWSVKAPTINANGNFFLYGNDVTRGLDVYKFTAPKAAKADAGGTWMTPTQAAAALPRLGTAAGYEPFCLLSDRL